LPRSNNVLAQAHRDPLREIEGIKKLECFSEKRLFEIRVLLKEVILAGKDLGVNGIEAREIEGEGIGSGRYLSKGGEGFLRIERRYYNRWWDKEIWGEIYDLENPWGDMSIEDEIKLKRLLNG